ncbi:MAG: hypothetical protein Q8P67_25120 [archaeon]|nr:hypothetical protein [archaeon]
MLVTSPSNSSPQPLQNQPWPTHPSSSFFSPRIPQQLHAASSGTCSQGLCGGSMPTLPKRFASSPASISCGHFPSCSRGTRSRRSALYAPTISRASFATCPQL